MWSRISIVCRIVSDETDPSIGKVILYVNADGAKALEVSLAELSGVSGVRGVTCTSRGGVTDVVFAHPSNRLVQTGNHLASKSSRRAVRL